MNSLLWLLSLVANAYESWIHRRGWNAGRASRLALEIEAANARIRAADIRTVDATPAAAPHGDPSPDLPAEGDHDRPVG